MQKVNLKIWMCGNDDARQNGWEIIMYLFKCYLNILNLNQWPMAHKPAFCLTSLVLFEMQLSIRAEAGPFNSSGTVSKRCTAAWTAWLQGVDIWGWGWACACSVCVWMILTIYWHDVDYPACGRLRPVWSSGGSHSTEEWWDNHTERERRACVRPRGWRL